MIKAIFLDIDGTLVSFKTHRMSRAVKDAIRDLRRKGIKVIIATGRPLYQVDNLEDVEFDGFLTMNGIINYADGKIIDSHPMSRENAIAIAKTAVRNHLPAFLFGETVKGINEQNELSHSVFKFINMPEPHQIDIVKTAGEYDIFMYTIFVTKEDEEKYLRPAVSNIDFPRWHPHLVDLIQEGYSKATAMDVFMKYYGIELDETMAFGDGGNDIPMLKYAGIGVAMGNADRDVKDAADEVTDSVDEDGIIATLKKHHIL